MTATLRYLSRLAAAVVLLLCMGCYRHPTLQQRTYSVAQLNLAADQREQLERDILNRTVHLEVWPPKKKHAKISRSAGIILTSDGYLLTAAHSIRSAPKFIFFAFPDNPQELLLLPVRTIWEGASVEGAPDLALLKVDVEGLVPFEWASDEDVRPDSVTIGAGSCMGGEYLTLVAGRVRGIAASSVDPPVSAIIVNAPIGRGDSGGPWVDVDGRLLGMAVGVAPEFSIGTQGLHTSRAGKLLRPDPHWLNRLIEVDRHQHPTTQPAKPLLKMRRIPSQPTPKT